MPPNGCKLFHSRMEGCNYEPTPMGDVEFPLVLEVPWHQMFLFERVYRVLCDNEACSSGLRDYRWSCSDGVQMILAVEEHGLPKSRYLAVTLELLASKKKDGSILTEEEDALYADAITPEEQATLELTACMEQWLDTIEMDPETQENGQ